jgi:hypothetical protein
MDAVSKEEEKKTELAHPVTVDKPFFTDFSTLQKLLQFTAYSLRFLKNVRSKPEDRLSGGITTAEYDDALLRLIQLAQQSEFSHEIRKLTYDKPLPTTSKLLQLNPFIDLRGFLRVGGRLQKAKIAEQTKHQIILPNQHLTKLIIDAALTTNFHAGFQLTWSTLLRKFWILRARDTIRHQIRKCVVCRKQRDETAQQLMGSLSAPRVNPSRPLLNSGVDYAGPYYLWVVRVGVQKHLNVIFFYLCMHGGQGCSSGGGE